MNKNFLGTCAAALLLGTSAAHAAPIDFVGLGFVETTPVYEGSGGVFYDDFFPLLSNDSLSPLVLDDFAGSGVSFLFDGTGFDDFVTVSYESVSDFERFDIVASGDNETDTLEFLLSRNLSNLTNGKTGLGANAIMRLSSGDFNFSNLAPLDFFADKAFNGVDAYDVTFSITALDSPLAPIPLPATLPLVLAGMGGLFIVGRRRPKRA
ncbi:VPLPA-CTERM sorting domain-containing protein [Roseovarius sp. ZX-A-9]|uniref:VPLPA-CTERM sorting domain-containing protein n=1 Tax=Roseovarius sp. ZX-A-9 TaxID=3014783 RepID=UPI00232B3CDF|nr:VPLPA-CTERM sorting domain-containing protein [Roseovarius sp. ZX-A-9]